MSNAPARAASPLPGRSSAEPSGARPSVGQPVPAYVVLTGNPNCGKTTVFNALTGLRAKVGNYAGVTVERKEGRLQGTAVGAQIRVLDLPGSYSLSPQSLDEQIARDVLLQRLPEVPPPALIVVVVDGSNLQRNLYYATQVIELGHPTILALNMVDVAEANGHHVDPVALASVLGVPVVPLIASVGTGIAELRREIISNLQRAEPVAARHFCDLPPPLSEERDRMAVLLAEAFQERQPQATAEALLILSNERALASSRQHYPQGIQDAVTAAREKLELSGIDWRSATIEARYARAAAIQQTVTTETGGPGETFSDKLDRIVTHKVWGTLLFVAVMTLMFQGIFTFARKPMEVLQAGVTWLGSLLAHAIPPGDLNHLLVDGVVAGVGAVVVFLPQIVLLFLFIGFLEDTGYMARAAFLMDRLMSKVGLHGKSFIPMLSSFACAIPGIMATRTIESPKDRLVTILIAPLMSCSARLPVYTLLIAACIPDMKVLGFLRLAGLTMLGMYLLGIGVALLMAWVFKKTLLKGETPMLIMELPPYKRPPLRQVLRHMWDRSKLFLRRAGTVILGINILLWFLATYPKSATIRDQFLEARTSAVAAVFPEVRQPDGGISRQQVEDRLAALRAKFAQPQAKTNAAEAALLDKVGALEKEEAGAALRNSFAGRVGRALAPIIAPLGFDWKIGIGIVASFAAREVFVSTMATVYNVGTYERSEAGMATLAQALQAQRRPDGTPLYTLLTGLTLMVFYVFALQCVSTVAVVRRETNSWKWPIFQWLYMGALAWGMAFAVRQVGLLLGWR